MEESEIPRRPIIFPAHDRTLASTPLGWGHHAPLLCLEWQPLPERARRSGRFLFFLAHPLQHIPLLLHQLRNTRIVVHPIGHRHPFSVSSLSLPYTAPTSGSFSVGQAQEGVATGATHAHGARETPAVRPKHSPGRGYSGGRVRGVHRYGAHLRAVPGHSRWCSGSPGRVRARASPRPENHAPCLPATG